VLVGAAELTLIALGLIYFLGTMVGGLRVLRAARRRGAGGTTSAGRHRGESARPQWPQPRLSRFGWSRSVSRWGHLVWRKVATAEEPAVHAGVLIDRGECVVYFIVPCLNEERVIEGTVRGLLADPRGVVVVVDDASDDRTGRLAGSLDPERVIVVRRELPAARRGKGPALNAGLAAVMQDAAARGIATSRITVCVMDADGRLSEGALDAVLPLFDDQRVGGVQLPVRIRRRAGSLLTLLQDVEFWGVCAVAQLGRISSGTVSLGGNGQFTRLSALLEVGSQPWRAQLTEDLDLALALAARGWRLTSTPDAWVSQQGLTSLRKLINQRTRWYQGHMNAIRWMRPLWSSRQLSHLGLLELTTYLLVPWALVLPWSLIFNYDLVLMTLWLGGWAQPFGMHADVVGRVVTVVVWYAVSCVPIWIAGYLYGRQQGKAHPLRALLLGHLLLLGNYVTYVACWRALFRLLTGANSWQKTQRHAERTHRRPAPAMSDRVRRPELAGPHRVASLLIPRQRLPEQSADWAGAQPGAGQAPETASLPEPVTGARR
jgi:1,2-diacylglycerol 3-beta-glucosyltransferase